MGHINNLSIQGIEAQRSHILEHPGKPGVTEEGLMLGSGKNKQGSWRRQLLESYQGESPHTHTFTSLLHYRAPASTIHRTFKLHLGTIFSMDYNLGRLKMTIKTLFFSKPTNTALGLSRKLLGTSKELIYLCPPMTV